MRSSGKALVLIASVLLLSGCSATLTPAAEPVRTPTGPRAADVKPAATRPPEPAPAQTPAPHPCDGYAVEVRSNDVEDRVGDYFGLPRDLGPVDGATGDVVLNAAGEPAAYIVAEGDTTYAIAERFCFGTAGYLEGINSIRRNGAWALMSDEDGQFVIFPGDTLNLDPYTIASVGDEQGVVYDHVPEFHIPPQR